MNADIRISVGFPNHPKTVKLERRLGFQGIRSLLALWTWAAQNRPDGDLGGANGRTTTVRRPLDEEDIEIAAQWPGEPGLFVATLVALGWLDRTERGYLLHEWQQHNPWVAAATDRSDKARFSRMAKTHPDIFKSLCARGIRAISAEEFARLKAGWSPDDRSTDVEEAFDDRLRFVRRSFDARSTTVERSFDDRSTPSPSPSPSPIEEKERVVLETAPADADEGAGPPDGSAALEDSATASSALARPVEAQEDGSDETLAENGTFAPPAVVFAPAASGTADLARDPPKTAAPAPVERAVEQAVAPGSIADTPRDAESAADDPVATASATDAPPGPALASMAAPAPRPDPAGDVAEPAATRDATRPVRRRSPVPAAMPDPPGWLPRALWDRWQSHRRALKKPMTADGALMALAQLEKAKGFGHDPAELLETAIANGWQGCVFPDRHYQPAPARPASGPARDGGRRSLREVPADPAVYLRTDGFVTELAAEEAA